MVKKVNAIQTFDTRDLVEKLTTTKKLQKLKRKLKTTNSSGAILDKKLKQAKLAKNNNLNTVE